jgi:hypothetical protein
MPDLMQHVCTAHPAPTVCASLAPAPDLHQTLDHAYATLIIWLGSLGPDTFWVLTAAVLGAWVVCPLLVVWTARSGSVPRPLR